MTFQQQLDQRALVERVRGELTTFRQTGDLTDLTPVATLAAQYGVVRITITDNLKRALSSDEFKLLSDLRRQAAGKRLSAIPQAERETLGRYAHSQGLGLLASTDFVDAGKKGMKANDRRHVWDGNEYRSKLEIAVARACIAYVPGFQPIYGKTFQVPIDGLKIDFLVETDRDMFFVEAHEPRLTNHGDFPSGEEHDRYKQAWLLLSPRERRQLDDQTKDSLAFTVYAPPRKAAIDEHSIFTGTELFVVWKPEHIYEQVICRVNQHPPAYAAFECEWRHWKRT